MAEIQAENEMKDEMETGIIWVFVGIGAFPKLRVSFWGSP